MVEGWTILVRLGFQAERYSAEDPNTCSIQLRQFGELLAQLVAATVGLYEDKAETQTHSSKLYFYFRLSVVVLWRIGIRNVEELDPE